MPLQNPDRQGGEGPPTTYLITWPCYGARLPGTEPSPEPRITSAALSRRATLTRNDTLETGCNSPRTYWTPFAPKSSWKA
jgi:hypothetical protein